VQVNENIWQECTCHSSRPTHVVQLVGGLGTWKGKSCLSLPCSWPSLNVAAGSSGRWYSSWTWRVPTAKLECLLGNTRSTLGIQVSDLHHSVAVVFAQCQGPGSTCWLDYHYATTCGLPPIFSWLSLQICPPPSQLQKNDWGKWGPWTSHFQSHWFPICFFSFSLRRTV